MAKDLLRPAFPKIEFINKICFYFFPGEFFWQLSIKENNISLAHGYTPFNAEKDPW